MSGAVQVLDDHRLELGEGPGYDPATDTAWWFDIPARRLYTRILSEGQTRRHDLPFAASALTITHDGRQLLVAENGLYLRDPASGALTLHLPLEADNPANRSNDARVHPSGAYWIGTMGRDALPGAGAWYHYFDGHLRRLWAGITIPNAACFAPDGSAAYFTDTPTGRIMRVATDPADGLPAAPPQVFLDGLDGPDGAVTDAQGNLWVALWGQGRVAGFAPDGQAIGDLTLPAAHTSCPAFIGRDAAQMLVTSARHGLDRGALAASPLAGATFVLPFPGKGRFDPPVRLGDPVVLS
ncbi:MAG: SMP-30/gluconolactonase/LRE family protein [Paracoccus sp. (in: a-proteobacteria)]|nr:SMP-30/gluconolactonase/LRE family protein [Paracoccus sp. (in: a-proteobacteria)]